MERTGWAAAVSTLYKTTGGRVVRITDYTVTDNSSGVVTEVIQGIPIEPPDLFLRWDGNGKCLAAMPAASNSHDQAGPHFDLANMIRGAK